MFFIFITMVTTYCYAYAGHMLIHIRCYGTLRYAVTIHMLLRHTTWRWRHWPTYCCHGFLLSGASQQLFEMIISVTYSADATPPVITGWGY